MVVFGCAILSNESEASYVWWLRSFLEAVKGKQPKSVITDGDLAMKSASDGRVLRKFRLCLMGDLEVDEFERIWTESVADHELEDHPWIVEMYAKKHS
ncbi:hypothetical protein AHAS_Ahas20G0110400 [Arachis hypogaea]